MASTLKKILYVFSALIFLTSSTHSQPVKENLTWPELMEKSIDKHGENFKGSFGVYIEDLGTKKKFTHNAGQRYYLASVIKIFVMVEIFRLVNMGKLSWKDRIKISDSNTAVLIKLLKTLS